MKNCEVLTPNTSASTQYYMNSKNNFKDILLGVSIGDALGVPVEFNSRETISHSPVTDMLGYGTHNKPQGTFSDDSSLTFCLAEALTEKFDPENIATNFTSWLYDNYWTAYNDVFDVGIATNKAIQNLAAGCQPDLAGGTDESDNGNGSLMRILPLVVYIKDKPIAERYNITKLVSSITHGHIRSVIACFYYLEFARQIISGIDKFKIYANLQKKIPEFLNSISIDVNEIKVFDRLLKNEIYNLNEKEIQSSGYVVHTLEASIWCILTNKNFSEAILKAVNLGEDTDTTGAVTGGLAALLYGWENIPEKWLNQLARKKDIEDLANRMEIFFNKV
ncbi:MAG: ADP-ribosylglycohydrolase family protein [Ginsengibacter sp.]